MTETICGFATCPISTRFKVGSVEELKIHVVKGNTATVIVPELSVSTHPGLNNEGSISNVEGVLTRVGMSYDSSHARWREERGRRGQTCCSKFNEQGKAS
jgi:C4-type Zn-finger protein